jgi:iron complex outermembrane receptor protein
MKMLLLLGLAGLPAMAAADSTAAPDSVVTAAPADTVLQLPEVHVDRDRPRIDAKRRMPTAATSDIPARASGRATENLADLLVQAPGIHVQQYGGLGAFSTVSVRGAPAGQIAVLVDGVPLNSGAHAVTNLSDLPLAAVDRIEIYRGLSPFGLGVSAPGGTINLVSVVERSRIDARIARGSFDSWDGSASGGVTRGPWFGQLRLGHQNSRADFDYYDDNATPFNAYDDSMMTRVNNQFTTGNAVGAIGWRPTAGIEVALHENFFTKQQGVPGLASFPALATQLDLTRAITHLTGSVEGTRFLPTARGRFAGTVENSRFQDLEGELGRGRHDTDDRLSARDAALELQWSRLVRGFSFQAAGNLRRENASLHDHADGRADAPDSRRDVRGASLGVQWSGLADHLVLHAAERREWIDDELHAFGFGTTVTTQSVARTMRSPQFGAAIDAGWGLGLRSNWTRGERAPDFRELFGDEGSVAGNSLLVPETSESWDLAFTWRTPAHWGTQGSASFGRFETHAADLIVYVKNTPSSVKALNVSSTRITGHEWAADVVTQSGLEGSLALTTQEAIDTGPVVYWNGKIVAQHPRHEGFARIGWRHAGWLTSTDVQWMGESFLDRYNRQRLAPRALIGARLGVPAFHPALRLIVEGRNLSDEQATDVAGFPLPGRSLWIAFEAGLGHRKGLTP